MRRGYVVISGVIDDGGKFNMDDVTQTFGSLDDLSKVLSIANKAVKREIANKKAQEAAAAATAAVRAKK